VNEVPRVGLGFDVHPRDDSRELRLGGVLFEGEPGLAGHSDADVVCHAVGEALLGASALGDLGAHFPEGDPSTAGLAGLELLRQCVELAASAGFRATSCDLTVVAERPAIAPRRSDMGTRLAEVLGVDPGAVSVKATRPEGLGLVGDGAGCLAVVVAIHTEP
jgi:2-C-methyl-D-erythritol 2,4-cyclodiphosphate synthase